MVVAEYPNADATGCETLVAPTVVISEVIEPYLYGLYIKGEPYIFVTPNAPNITKTTIHESVHYILDNLGLETDRCKHEAVARKISSRLTNTEVDATWAKRYRCPEDGT